MDSINQENAVQTHQMNEHSDSMESLSMTPVTHIFTEPSAPIVSNEVAANLEVVETLCDMVDNMAEAHYESDEMENMQRPQMNKRPAKRSASRGRSRSRKTVSKSNASKTQKASPARAASKSKAKSRSKSSTRNANKSKPKPRSTSANRKSSRGRSNSRRRN